VNKNIIWLLLATSFLALVSCQIFQSIDVMNSTSLSGYELAFCGRVEDEYGHVYLMDLSSREWINIADLIQSPMNNEVYEMFMYTSVGCEFGTTYRIYGMDWSPAGDAIVMSFGTDTLKLAVTLLIDDNGSSGKFIQQWETEGYEHNIFEEPIELAWSPKGDQIAFIGSPYHDTSQSYRNLFIGSLVENEEQWDDFSIIQVTNELRDFPGVFYAPVWSPDGNYISVSYLSPNNGILISSSDGTELVHINDEYYDELSPYEEIWIISPDVDNASLAIQTSWLPDSSGLVFVADYEGSDRTSLFRVNRDGTNLELLIPSGVRNPVVSPNGEHIAYIEYAENRKFGEIGKIVMVDMNGGNRKVLKTLLADSFLVTGLYYIVDLSWSPDGKWLAFSSNVNGRYQIFLLSADGEQLIVLDEFLGDAVFPRWRPTIE
jgi:Tol biopolymer transport system component